MIHRIFYAVKRLVKFFQIVFTSKTDVVMAFTSYGFGFMEKGMIITLAKLFNKKTVIAPRSGFLMDNINESLTFRWVARRIFNKSDMIICQGQFWKDYFQNKLNIDPNKLVIINNWIDVQKYSFHINNSNSPINALFMGALERNKGIFDLIPVIDALKEKGVQWTFAGEGNDRYALNEMLKQRKLSSCVSFKGWVKGKDKIQLLREAHIVVIPSYREGLPNILLEAMASGCGIIVSKVGAVPDLIQNNVNGYLIQPGNIPMILQCMEEYILHPERLRKHAKNALTTVLEKNDISSIVPKFEKILTE